MNQQFSKINRQSVISGHQVGLLGGPLFILYKILGVYHQAQSKELIPIYWLESNDADFQEIASFYFLNKQDHLKKLTWKGGGLSGQSIGEQVIDKNLHNLYKVFFEEITPTSHTEEIKELVFDSYQLGITLKEANRIFYKNLFSDLENSFPVQYKMKWFDPSEDQFRNFSQNLLRQEIINTPIDEQTPVFALINGRREALFKKNDSCLTRAGQHVDYKKVVLLPSLKNRSLLQDAYCDVAYYIAGPSEKIYLNELKPRYSFYGIEPSKIVERMSLTIIDAEIKGHLEQLGFDEEFLLKHNKEELIRWLQNSLQNYDFHQAKKNLFKFKNHLIKKLNNESSLSSLSLQSNRDSIKDFEKKFYLEVKHFFGTKRKIFKETHQTKLHLFEKVSNFLYPEISSVNLKQERVYNIVSLINRYGTKVIQEIYQQYAFQTKFFFKK